MPHCDPDDLALRALGESVGTPVDDNHLAGCPRCQLELEELRAVVRAGRSSTAHDRLVTPPDRVWDGILGGLGLRHSDQSAQPTQSAQPGQPTQPAGRPEPAEFPRHLTAVPAPVRGPAETAAAPAEARATQPSRPDKRWWRGTAALVTAAATAGLLAGLGVGAMRGWTPAQDATPGTPGRPGGTEPTVLAQVSLEPLGDRRAEGDAVLTEQSGRRSIEIHLTGLPEPAAGSYYEVWLIDRGVAQLVSLGPLDQASTTVPVPAGLDLAAYPVLDVSVEAFDGNPGHSSDSVVRGVLPV